MSLGLIFGSPPKSKMSHFQIANLDFQALDPKFGFGSRTKSFEVNFEIFAVALRLTPVQPKLVRILIQKNYFYNIEIITHTKFTVQRKIKLLECQNQLLYL